MKTGDIVILTRRLYTPTESFPVWPSHLKCLGTVTAVLPSGRVLVKWSNGHRNDFTESELAVVDGYVDAVQRFGGAHNKARFDPNYEFYRRKRRRS